MGGAASAPRRLGSSRLMCYARQARPASMRSRNAQSPLVRSRARPLPSPSRRCRRLPRLVRGALRDRRVLFRQLLLTPHVHLASLPVRTAQVSQGSAATVRSFSARRSRGPTRSSREASHPTVRLVLRLSRTRPRARLQRARRQLVARRLTETHRLWINRAAVAPPRQCVMIRLNQRLLAAWRPRRWLTLCRVIRCSRWRRRLRATPLPGRRRLHL